MCIFFNRFSNKTKWANFSFLNVAFFLGLSTFGYYPKMSEKNTYQYTVGKTIQ